MVALGVLFLVAGIAVLAVKVLVALVVLPLKIGFGIAKLVLLVLIGIPLAIFGIALAALAIPLILVGLPVLLLLGLIATPVIIVAKALL